MNVTISIAEKSVKLGEPVTINYSSSGFLETRLVVDNLPNPIDLGFGDVSGKLKFLPIFDGEFNATIIGYIGEKNSDGDYYKQKSATAGIEVK